MRLGLTETFVMLAHQMSFHIVLYMLPFEVYLNFVSICELLGLTLYLVMHLYIIIENSTALILDSLKSDNVYILCTDYTYYFKHFSYP